MYLRIRKIYFVKTYVVKEKLLAVSFPFLYRAILLSLLVATNQLVAIVEREHELVGVEPETGEDRPAHRLLVGHASPPGAVDREQHPRTLVRRDQRERGQLERAMRALRALPVRRTPVLGADAEGRGDVASGDADARASARNADAIADVRRGCRVVHTRSSMVSMMPPLTRS